MSARKRGLGRGLDALLATSQSSAQKEQDAAEVNSTNGELSKLPIEYLVPGKYQPRKDMSPEALEELASSIRAQGIIQPIVVRKVDEHRYEIIAGERRWRASQLAQLDEVPCLVKNVPDEAAVAIALIENIQREDLNAMEEAQALDRLMNEFALTHQEVAEAVGKSRTTVTNLLRLNNLNDDVKLLVEHGDIEMGHARALLALEGDTQSETAQVVSGKGLTVRDTEKLVKKHIKSSFSTQHGTKSEKGTLDMYNSETGAQAKPYNVMMNKSFETFNLRGKIDGLIENENTKKIVEIKNRTKRLFYMIRMYEMIQVQLYMNMLNCSTADLVEHYKGSLNICNIDYDEDLVISVINRIKVFDLNLERMFEDKEFQANYFSSDDRSLFILQENS